MCCGPILAGKTTAPTAEALMRSRYTAHAINDFAYLHRTFEETRHTPYEEEEYGNEIKWTKLVINSHEPDVRPGVSHVDFSAHFEEQGQAGVMHEKSEFELKPEGWIFTKTLREGPAPIKKEPKVGRNDPCPCGSGKKFKKCCGR
ncbi:MAG: YchJ family protein [Synoicihabitans sp.]